MARKLYMQAEAGSGLLSHLPVSIDCHATGHYKHPLPVLAVPLVSSGSSAWTHKASSHTSSSPWMAGDSQGHGITTSTNRRCCGTWVKYSVSTLAARTVPSPSLEVQGSSTHCATAGEPAPSPGRWAAFEVREGETGDNCPSQQKHAVAGGERKRHSQVLSKSSSRWSKLKRTMEVLFTVEAINSDILIFSPTFTLHLLQKQRLVKRVRRWTCLVFKV